MIGTAEAKAVLQDLAKGAASASVTRPFFDSSAISSSLEASSTGISPAATLARISSLVTVDSR
jgi:hypothetical protein